MKECSLRVPYIEFGGASTPLVTLVTIMVWGRAMLPQLGKCDAQKVLLRPPDGKFQRFKVQKGQYSYNQKMRGLSCFLSRLGARGLKPELRPLLAPHFSDYAKSRANLSQFVLKLS